MKDRARAATAAGPQLLLVPHPQAARVATAVALLPADRVAVPDVPESRDPHAGRADSRERILKEL
jgi:hypothetical protein